MKPDINAPRHREFMNLVDLIEYYKGRVEGCPDSPGREWTIAMMDVLLAKANMERCRTGAVTN